MPMSEGVVLYKSSHCGACAQLVPLVLKVAAKKGVKIKIVDVDACGKACDRINYVPYVEINGKRVDTVKFVKGLLKKKGK
jgi:thiol-disulfide isomerase/thioredoxin